MTSPPKSNPVTQQNRAAVFQPLLWLQGWTIYGPWS